MSLVLFYTNLEVYTIIGTVSPADCFLHLRGESYHIFFHPDYTVGCGIPPHQRFRSQVVTAGQGFHLAPKIFIGRLFLELVRRIAGEVGDYAVWIFRVEHLKGRVVSGLIISLDNGILQRSLFDGLVVHKDGLATQANPLIGRGGNADLNVGIRLQLLVDLFEVAGG